MLDYIKGVFKNRKVLFSMVKNDFVNRFANTSLGAIWGFASPMLIIVLYVFVFEYILKLNTAGNYPYLVWFLPGFAIWNFLSEAILTTTNSIREYSYLVKKIVFPVDVIPLIKVFSNFTVFAVLAALVIGICAINGFFPNILLFTYFTVSALIFVTVITRLFSALAVMLGDFAYIVNVLIQLMFWATPIIWNIADVEPKLQAILKYNPFAYLVCGMRDAFVGGNIICENNCIYTIVFWCITIILFVYGNAVFNKNKDEFADML